MIVKVASAAIKVAMAIVKDLPPVKVALAILLATTVPQVRLELLMDRPVPELATIRSRHMRIITQASLVNKDKVTEVAKDSKIIRL